MIVYDKLRKLHDHFNFIVGFHFVTSFFLFVIFIYLGLLSELIVEIFLTWSVLLALGDDIRIVVEFFDVGEASDRLVVGLLDVIEHGLERWDPHFLILKVLMLLVRLLL